MPSCFLLFDSDILKSIFGLLGTCPECDNKSIDINSDLSEKKGLSVLLNFICTTPTCLWNRSFHTSKEVKTDGRGKSPFEINHRALIAMREIGKGHTALSTFCGFMNMPQPMNVKPFNDMQENISNVYKEVANTSMKNAANEFRFTDDDEHNAVDVSLDDNKVTDITVSCDGTWQRRGYSSLNGVVTVIASDSGKCVDYRVLSKTCSACTSWEPRKESEPELYQNFLETHVCSINHEGSAGSMEAAGVVDCFMESISKRKLRYTHYIGDGDSKSHADVVKNDPYPGIIVEKLECVGHIQKRVGGRLRKLKATNKTQLADGKTLGGKGRLTEKVINKLQNYFGIAVRQSTGTTVYQLRKAIGAVLFHCSDAPDLETRHRMCPRTKDSWCKYQADKLNDTNTYKDKSGIPAIICEKIKPVFTDLSDDKLLSKCLHGKTQNNNESINGVIWKRCPKDVFVGRGTLELGVSSAVISFNDGVTGILDIFKLINITPGVFTKEYCKQKDKERIFVMEQKSSDTVKHRRKQLRAQRKGFSDATEEKEGVVYGAGLF